MATTEAMKPTNKKGAFRLLEFIEFVEFIALIEFIKFVEYLGLIEFINLNFIGTKEKMRRTVRITNRGIWRML